MRERVGRELQCSAVSERANEGREGDWEREREKERSKGERKGREKTHIFVTFTHAVH